MAELAVLVCGSRASADAADVEAALDALHVRTPIAVLITGDCPDPADDESRRLGLRSVDQVANEWANRQRGRLASGQLGVALELFAIDRETWARDGRAGPQRNRAMAERLASLRDRHPHPRVMVLTFPGGRGTASMIAEAERLALPVYEVRERVITRRWPTSARGAA